MASERCLPMLFDGESVRGILAGTKTATRRLITSRTCFGVRKDLDWSLAILGDCFGEMGDALWVPQLAGGLAVAIVPRLGPRRVTPVEPFPIPPGRMVTEYRPAPLAYVRESMWHGWTLTPPRRERWEADAGFDEMARESALAHGCRLVPSIHVPRSASRLRLRIGRARFQRVRDLSHAEILSEGIIEGPGGRPRDLGPKWWNRWDSINGKHHDYDGRLALASNNHWVVVYEDMSIVDKDSTPVV